MADTPKKSTPAKKKAAPEKKKPAAKKTAAKKTAVKKAEPEKKAAPAKKAPAKKAAVKKAEPAKKAPAKKAAVKKAEPAKKAPAKKAAVKKAEPAKKAPAKKAAVKKAEPAKKAPAKKAAVKKAEPAKKAPAKKAVAQKTEPVKKAEPAKKPEAPKVDDSTPSVYEPLAPPRVTRFKARTTYRMWDGRVKSSTRFVPVRGVAAVEVDETVAGERKPTPVKVEKLGEGGARKPQGSPAGRSRPDRPDRRDEGRERRPRREESRERQKPQRSREEAPVEEKQVVQAPVEQKQVVQAPVEEKQVVQAPEPKQESPRQGKRPERAWAQSTATIREMLQDENPDISVVLRTQDGGGQVATLVNALTSQKMLYPFEIVAVDLGSKDDTVAVLERLGVRVVRHQGRDLTDWAFLQSAFKETVGEMVIFLAQSSLPPDERWLDLITGQLLDDSKVVLAQVGGKGPRGRVLRFDAAKGGADLHHLRLDGTCLRRAAWDKHAETVESPEDWLASAIETGGVRVVVPEGALKRQRSVPMVPTPDVGARDTIEEIPRPTPKPTPKPAAKARPMPFPPPSPEEPKAFADQLVEKLPIPKPAKGLMRKALRLFKR